MRWHKRRWRCREPRCERKTFTESTDELPPGAGLTGRLRRALAGAIEDNRCVDEVARSFGVSWPTAQRAFDARAAATAGEPAATPVLGIDETRRERARWLRGPDRVWRRSAPWETGFVDLADGNGLLGQVPGRTSRCVVDWLEAHSEVWRAGVQFVALDPYAAAVRQALPHATIVVDHFHLVQLANSVVTRVRQRVTQQALGRRGQRSDPVWANRRLLLRGRERLSESAFARLWNSAVDNDPSGELLATWIAKEELRGLLGCAARGGVPANIAHHQHRFFSWCAGANVPEVTTLAETIDHWWPEMLAFLRTAITNAGTEGTNRLVKQVLRGACGFRNTQHYRDRVRLHCARKASAKAILPAVS